MIDIEILMNNNSFDLKSYRRQIDDLGQIFHPSPQSPALSGGKYPSAKWSSRKAPIC